ncbi:hypothetical protein AUI06_05230 [archaeon 13_2_20CM_2_52_21]|nr:MAG: hypothetical protein AUI06_05230 [archaeon 13_2_20CM_2_52_21]
MSKSLSSSIDAAEKEWLASWKRGPTLLRWARVPIQTGDKAPEVRVLDYSGRIINLRDSWKDRPALLVFWRHYGCGCGLERGKRLQQEYNDFVRAGAGVVVVGQGEPERAKAYAEKYGIPCTILSDPRREAYEAYGLLEGRPSQILYDAPENLVRCDYDAGVRLASTRREAGRPLVDSPWQLPGEFVISTSGIVNLAYRYQYCEDFPNPLVLLASIKDALNQT